LPNSFSIPSDKRPVGLLPLQASCQATGLEADDLVQLDLALPIRHQAGKSLQDVLGHFPPGLLVQQAAGCLLGFDPLPRLCENRKEQAFSKISPMGFPRISGELDELLLQHHTAAPHFHFHALVNDSPILPIMRNSRNQEQKQTTLEKPFFKRS